MTLALTEYLSRAQKDGYVSFSEKKWKNSDYLYQF